MEISDNDIRRVRELCRLRFDDFEAFREEFLRIVRFVDAVRELKTDEVEPMYYPGRDSCPERDDKVGFSLPPHEALRNAPHRLDDFFAVPKVL